MSVLSGKSPSGRCLSLCVPDRRAPCDRRPSWDCPARWLFSQQLPFAHCVGLPAAVRLVSAGPVSGRRGPDRGQDRLQDFDVACGSDGQCDGRGGSPARNVRLPVASSGVGLARASVPRCRRVGQDIADREARVPVSAGGLVGSVDAVDLLLSLVVLAAKFCDFVQFRRRASRGCGPRELRRSVSICPPAPSFEKGAVGLWASALKR